MTLLEVQITLKSGTLVELHMDELMFKEACALNLSNSFEPAAGYHRVYINWPEVESMIVTGTIDEVEDGQD